jgi:hypothetical protein
MQEKNTNQTRLPLPKWAMYTLAFPTFYMPLAYASLVVWIIEAMLLGHLVSPPYWMIVIFKPALYVTYCMWPFYLIWVIACKKLNWKEKAWWSLIIFLLNMVGMPMFYIFITRRYLGYEGRTGNKDEASFNLFLKRYSIGREELSSEQLDVLKSYCRKFRLSKWGVLPMIVISCLVLYTAIFFFPKHCIKLFSDFIPTRTVIIDSKTDEKKEITPDSEAIELHIKTVMMMGVIAGLLGAMGIFGLTQAISFFFGNWHRKALIDFLKAKKKEHLTNQST